MAQQNFPADSTSSYISSPLIKGAQDYKPHAFKSPITSAQKKRFPKFKMTNENLESDQHPFAGPTYAPLNFIRGKNSPSPFKIKEEYTLGDFTGNSKDYNMLARHFESPLGASTKDLALSPCVYKFTSPGNNLFMRGQSNNNNGGFQNNAYASFFDFNGSPTFARKNITRLDFNNNPSNKFIMMKSHKDEVTLEHDDHSDYLDSCRDMESKHFGFPIYDDTPLQSTQLKFPSKKSVYTSTMVPSQTRADDIYSYSNSNSRTTQDTTSRKEPRYLFYTEQHDEDTDTVNNPRTPSPTLESKIKLEALNSFSTQPKAFDTATTRRGLKSEDHHSNYSNSQNSTVKVNAGHGEGDDEQNQEDEYCTLKAKKKVCCNCKKSRCLKLYCDCFNRGQPCEGDCNCVNCLNTVAHAKEREEAMRAVLERNPSAFKPKVDQTASPEKVEDDTSDQGRVRHIRGCNCKKSGCQKRYCECYQAGVKCTELCKCEHCKNMDSCCRLKRAQKYGFVNFGSQDSISISMPYSETKALKHYNKHSRKNLEFCPSPEEDEGTTYYTGNSAARSHLMHSHPDPSFYSDLPLQKKRKIDVTVSEFTPKRTLVFVKEEHRNVEDHEEGQFSMHIHREKKNGVANFRASYAQSTDKKKRMTKIEEPSEYDPNPAGRRPKRNVKPFSQFNSDEYELGK